nr:hypothetical protein [Tanacetum cinerariifolium]
CTADTLEIQRSIFLKEKVFGAFSRHEIY